MRIQDKGRFAHLAGHASQIARLDSESAIIHNFALKSSFFMPLGVCRLNRRILLLVMGFGVSMGLTSCGVFGSGYSLKKPTSGLTMRVLASQGTTATTDFGGLVYINGQYDILARVQELSAGTSPGLMAISPNREIVAAFDAGSNSVYSANTASESSGNHVQLPGPTFSMAVPTASGLAFAAVPSAEVTGYSFLGAVDYINISSGSIIATIAVPNAQTIVSNSDGSQILAFSSSSNPEFANSVI